MTPGDEATNFVSAGELDNTGRHQYTVTGLTAGDEYEIAMAPADNVTVTDGTVTFADDADDDEADDLGTTEATIELVNGSATGNNAGGTEEDTATATADADGQVTFTVDSDAADSVIPVIWADADSEGDLDLDADDAPSEDFAIGGQKNWIPAEAPQGEPAADVTVLSTDLDADSFVGNDGSDDFTYFYDDNDTYRLNGVAITMSQFEGLLTADDEIDEATSNYEPDQADSSTFNVISDVVPSPTELEATVSDLDGDGDEDDLTLMWTASTQGDVSYNVYTDGGGTSGTFEPGTDTLVENTSATSVEITDGADGTDYFVGAEAATSGEVSTGDPSASGTSPVADTDGPEVVADAATVDVDGGLNGIADSGDEWVIHFDEDVTVAADAAIQVTGGGFTAIVENGVNATFTADGSTVTVEPTETLTEGSDALSYPLTIDDAAGFSDDVGNASEFPADWTDVTLEDEGAQLFTADATDGESEFTVTFNEPVDETSAEDDTNWTFTDDSAGGEDIDTLTLGADGRTVTVELTGALEAGADSISADSVEDTDGQTDASSLTL